MNFDIVCTCKLTKEEYDLSVKNPHITGFFCGKSNIQCTEKSSELKNNTPITRATKYAYEYYGSSEYPLGYMKGILKDVFQEKLPVTFEDAEDLVDPDFVRESKKEKVFTTLHVGQLKLFLSTMQFLLKYSVKNEETHVIYPGSAPGSSLIYIMDLFPRCYWYLIDPQELTGSPNPTKFDSRLFGHPKVKYIVKDFFTDEICNMLKKKLKGKRILLISDIRITAEEEDLIDRDNELQERWVLMLRPDFAQLKFRVPRIGNWEDDEEYNGVEEGHDEEQDYEPYEYLDGEVYLQMFAPVMTTETRLVVDGKNLSYCFWSPPSYKRVLTFFNQKLRPSYYPSENLADCTDHCFDCVSMCRLIEEYMMEYPENSPDQSDPLVALNEMVNEIMDIVVGQNKLCKNMKLSKYKFYRNNPSKNNPSKNNNRREMKN